MIGGSPLARFQDEQDIYPATHRAKKLFDLSLSLVQLKLLPAKSDFQNT